MKLFDWYVWVCRAPRLYQKAHKPIAFWRSRIGFKVIFSKWYLEAVHLPTWKKDREACAEEDRLYATNK
jgi:hypothetical protein